MKIYRNAQDVPGQEQYQNEGRNHEENIPERDQFEARQEMDRQQTSPRETHTGEIINSIKPSFDDYLGGSWVGNGSVGWFQYKDGVVYEIQVTPLAHAKYKSLFHEQNKPPMLEEADKLP